MSEQTNKMLVYNIMSSNSQNTITETQSESRSPKAGRKSPKPGSRSPKPGKKTSKSRNTSEAIDSFILDKINKYCSKLDRDIEITPNLIGRFIINLDDLQMKVKSPNTRKLPNTRKMNKKNPLVEETPPSVQVNKKSGSNSPGLQREREKVYL